MDIMKTLYTVGDSFTYGEELNNPTTQAWPAVLAERLGYNLINEGHPGVGNEYIVKKTVLALSKYKPDLVIVGWTSCSRKEFADAQGVYDIWPAHNRRKFSNDQYRFRLPLIDYITKHNNDLHDYRTWLRQVVLLQSYLQVNNQSYLFCCTHDNQHRFGQNYRVCQDYYDLIDNTKFVGWPNDGFVEWAYGTPHGPGGHPLEQGHERIAQEIARHL
jgi:lysophospholipase L1-like esterase